MYSGRGLLALTVVSALLWVAVIVDMGLPRAPERVSRRIVPELYRDQAQILAIRWRQAGRSTAPGPALVRSPGGVMALAGPGGASAQRSPNAVVNQAVVADIVATLELLSYVRVSRGIGGERARAGLAPPRLVIELEIDIDSPDGPGNNRTVVLELGERIAAMDRVWLARRDRDELYLIEGYAARALDRSLGELRERRVFALAPAAMRAIEIHAGGTDRGAAGPWLHGETSNTTAGDSDTRAEPAELLLSGSPAMVHAGELGGHVRADGDKVLALAERLAALAIERFVTPAEIIDSRASSEDDQDPLTVRVLGPGGPFELHEIGACPGDERMRLVDTSIGTGCVSAGALAEVAALAHTSFYQRRLVASTDIVALTAARPDRPPIVLHGDHGTWSMDDQPLETNAVNEWLDMLAGSTSERHIAANRIKDAEHRLDLELTHAGGDIERVAFFTHPRHGVLARRQGEPIYLVQGAAAATALAVEPGMFRRRQLLMLEPYGLREAVARRGPSGHGAVIAHLVRGELLDDWQVRVPAGATLARPDVPDVPDLPDLPDLIDTLRELGRLRARRFVAEQARPIHGLTPPRRSIELTFDPGPIAATAEPERHVVELGNTSAGGCFARLDGQSWVFELERVACTVLLAPWAR